MRTTFILAGLILVLAACKKDKYTTTPQIKFKSISPDFASSNSLTSLNKEAAPKLTIEITDAEGDIGFIEGRDTSRVFIKNLKSGNLDSFYLPDIGTASVKNFKGDAVINLFNALDCISPGPPRPRMDTLYFEVYIVDFARNKSNTIVTDRPVFYLCE